jgi:hypothetical protein
MDLLLSPSLILSLIIASAYAALFNLWQGGSGKKLAALSVGLLAGFRYR